jgi:DNA-binding NtrC family response regulator
MARLLLAEDDHLMRWSLEKYLSHGGHAVHSVESGDEAIEAAKCDEYRVVITDYALPGSDGLHVLQSIKARNPKAHVIVITGHAAPQMERLARDIGAFEFFEKPFQLVALKQAVEKALVTPERRKGPRGCCGKCVWDMPCDHSSRLESRRVH